MSTDRIATFTELLERNPDDARLRFGLATELEKLERWEEAAAQLARYLELADDEGNAWGRLGHALLRLGRDDEARDAYRAGIAAALRHNHPSMAAEFEEILGDRD